MPTTPAPESPASQPPGTSPRELFWVGGLILALVIGGAWWINRPAPTHETKPTIRSDASDYLGDRACGSCHPGETASHGRSGHSRTLQRIEKSPIARKIDGRRTSDPERPGVTWTFAFLDGRFAVEREEAGQVERSLIEYVFGSGHHAATFVSLVDRDPAQPKAHEQRLSYFAHADDLGLTPGQSLEGHARGNSPSGRIHSASDTRKCFECHATRISNRGPKFLDEATMIPNVSCERCHGPARSHVEAARKGLGGETLRMPQGPDRWTAAEQMKQCGECHRTPEMVQPGSIRVDNPVLVRHQPVGLMQSVCYQKSEGRLSCVTCHDPHSKTSTERIGYETACLSCHQESARQTPCPVSPSTGCLDCHMPKRDVARGMKMTDHWIQRRPGTIGDAGRP